MTAWCLADGYGFHQGFFHWKRFVENGREAPASFNLEAVKQKVEETMKNRPGQ